MLHNNHVLKLYLNAFCQLSRGVGFQTIRKMAGKSSNLYVRSVKGEERLQIILKYCRNLEENNPNTERVFNFDRLQIEELHKSLARMTANIKKVIEKKVKRKENKHIKPSCDSSVEKNAAHGTCADSKAEGLQPVHNTIDVTNNSLAANDVNSEAADDLGELITLTLFNKGVKVPDETPNKKAWTNGAILSIGDQQCEVFVNMPTVKRIVLPDCSMVGFLQFPRMDTEFVDLDKCQFKWFRNIDEETHTNLKEKHTCKKLSHTQKNDLQQLSLRWEEIYTGLMYLPTSKDIGKRLKFTCLPVDEKERTGFIKEAFSKNKVTSVPDVCPFERRHRFTKTRTQYGSFRIVTYNILADVYADSDYSRDYLYPYCPSEFLAMDYRKQLLLKEITGYNADIVCLQELDLKLFSHTFLPIMQSQGFQGIIKCKDGEISEGTAILFKEDKFRLLSRHDMNMSQALQSDEEFKDVLEKISTNASLKEKMLARKTIVQAAVFQSVENASNHILAVTTHLYFHPRAPHIRILQTLMCVRHIERVLASLAEKQIIPAVVFCGDFNSYPEGGVHNILNDQQISAHHADWYCCGKEEYIEGMEFSHSLTLSNACGFPRYTNFVTGFSGCLDYIYTDPTKLKVEKVIPMPTHEEVTKYTALPNAVFPSDHIAVVCDLGFLNSNS